MSQVFVLFLIGYFENLGCFVLKLFFGVMGFLLLLGVLKQLLSSRREKVREKDEIFFLFCYCCCCCGWDLVCGRQNEKSVEDWWKKGWKKLTHKKEVAGRRELQEEEKEEAAKLVSLESGPELWFVKIRESEKRRSGVSAICLCEKLHIWGFEMMKTCQGQLFWMRMPYLETRNCELLWEVGWDFRL
jgi:uncharacterized protein YbdZ (MbtH family)